MKKIRLFGIISFVILFTVSLTACAKKDASMNTADMAVTSESAPAVADYGYTSVGGLSVTFDSDTSANTQIKATSGTTDTSATASGSTDTSNIQTQDKIIRTFFLDVETQEFDSLIAQIRSEVSRLQGYVESSNTSGKRYNYSEDARNGNIVARIPSDKVDEFVNTVGESANVINKQESTENVSLQYIEAESRIETLKIEQERLFAILDKEVSLENIITLESRLSDIRYELQNYESQLRYYDNKVEFSTVTMNIQEVEKLTPVSETKESVGTRIKNGFSNTMYRISEGFKDFLVWFIVNLPYLLIWALIIIVVVIVVKRIYKKQKAKDAALPPPPVPPVMFYGQNNTNGQDQSKNQP